MGSIYGLPSRGINISHLGKRKIIFKMPFLGDMLVSWRVFSESVPSTFWNFTIASPEMVPHRCHTGTSHHCTFQALCRWAIGWQEVYIWSWRRHETKHCSLSKNTGMTFQLGGISVYKFRVQKNTTLASLALSDVDRIELLGVRSAVFQIISQTTM